MGGLKPDLSPIAADGSADVDTHADTDADRARFVAKLQQAAGWSRLVLAKPAPGSGDLQRVVARPLQLKGQACIQLVYSHSTRDLTRNLPQREGLALIESLLGRPFRNAHLFDAEHETQLLISKKGRARMSQLPLTQPAQAAQLGHDREKQRWLELDRPFLSALGVTNAQHQLVPAMARKWKQINKFVEVFAHALARSRLAQAKSLSVVDFGAGKAYLSFAIHDWLRHSRGVEAQVTGVELRADLVAQGQRIITKLGLQGLQLDQGDVRDGHVGAMNVMIALHACDTATDHAIHLGLRAGADIILCSPCCHKQLRPQLLSPHPLRSVFQHGIHAEQQAEMVTDSLRALLLQAQGYDTQVFEFVALEHTSKNKMILAIKREQSGSPDAALAQVKELKAFFGVREHCLESLLLAS